MGKKYLYVAYAITFIILTVGLSLALTYFQQPLYKATIKIEAQPAFIIGGSSRPMSAGMSTYLELINDENFKAKVIRKLSLNNKDANSIEAHYSTNIKAEALPDTNILVITAESDNPSLASEAANIGAEIFISEEEKRWADITTSWVDIIKKDEIVGLDRDLLRLRTKLNEMKNNEKLKPLDRTIKAQAIQDEIDSTKSERAYYADFVSRANLSNIMNRSTIRALNKAEVPQEPFKPNLAQNLAISVLVSLLVAVFIALLLIYVTPGVYKKSDHANERYQKVLSQELTGRTIRGQ